MDYNQGSYGQGAYNQGFYGQGAYNQGAYDQGAYNQGSYGQGAYNQNNGKREYDVDMVFCIDATGSMEDFTGNQTKIINMVKQNAINFYTDFKAVMDSKGKIVNQLRVRIVAFRDYIADGEGAMLVTDFFQLPQQAEDFNACIQSITASGGGDIPEDGLEALAYAIKSNWSTNSTKKRNVIVVWTDAPAHDLGHGRRAPNYPKGMPESMSALNDWWDEMNFNIKRLVLFAPGEGHWNYISDNWDNTLHFPSVAGNGLAERTYDVILHTVAESF